MKTYKVIVNNIKSHKIGMLVPLFILAITLTSCFVTENIIPQKTQIQSFTLAKEILEEYIYANTHERVTLYCEAPFDEDMNIRLPDGIVIENYKNRMHKDEGSHG